MFRPLAVAVLLVAFSVALALPASTGGVNPDDVIYRYPAGFTKLLVADMAKLLGDPVLAEGVMTPLQAARHPLHGIRQIIQDTLRVPPTLVEYVAHGTGPGLTGMSLLQGVPQAAAFGPLFGLQFAVGAPGSPYANWELSQSNGLPLIRTGGLFGPVQIQWGYAFEASALWVGTEVGFGGPPNSQRLDATMAAVTARAKGQGAYFDELAIAAGVRSGDISFVRQTEPATDRPAMVGEQALGFSMRFVPGSAWVDFEVRFSSEAAATAALASLRDGTSPYLAQDLYQGALLTARQQGKELLFTVQSTLAGAVGLLLVALPGQ